MTIDAITRALADTQQLAYGISAVATVVVGFALTIDSIARQRRWATYLVDDDIVKRRYAERSGAEVWGE